jgi:hypothetical protein
MGKKLPEFDVFGMHGFDHTITLRVFDKISTNSHFGKHNRYWILYS